MQDRRYQLWLEDMRTGVRTLMGSPDVLMTHVHACRFKRAHEVGRKWQRFYIVEVK